MADDALYEGDAAFFVQREQATPKGKSGLRIVRQNLMGSHQEEFSSHSTVEIPDTHSALDLLFGVERLDFFAFLQFRQPFTNAFKLMEGVFPYKERAPAPLFCELSFIYWQGSAEVFGGGGRFRDKSELVDGSPPLLGVDRGTQRFQASAQVGVKVQGMRFMLELQLDPVANIRI